MPSVQDDLFTTNAIACFDCGCVNDQATMLLQEMRDEIDTLKTELSTKLRKIKRLQGDVDAQVRASKNYEPAMRVLSRWKELCHPNAVELDGERVKKVIARLNAGYSEQSLALAVIGYARFPYVVEGRRLAHGSPSQRFIDAELIFRDPKHVDQGIALAEESQYRNGSMPPSTFERIPWVTVMEANRQLIVKFLRASMGGPLTEDGVMLWPCPRCDNDPALTLRVFPPGHKSMVECSSCGLTEKQLLGLIP